MAIKEATEPKSKLSGLNDWFKNAESVDKDLFPEQRSNILLVSGEHYSKLVKQAFSNIRGRQDVAPEQKIRLTKNHIQRIIGIYKQNILSAAPGVAIFPHNEQDLNDQASAKIRQSIWSHAKKKYRLKERFRDDAQSFLTIGEVFTVQKWNPDIGKVVGYESQVDEDGQDVVDEQGQLVADEAKPVFSGDFEFVKHYGFNTFRDPEAESFQTSRRIGFRLMTDLKALKERYKDDEEKLKFLSEDGKQTYKVFDGQNGQYVESKNQIMLRERYERPCYEYPRGYFTISTESGILEEGELPGGIWPVVTAICDKIETSPRGRSPIKTMRPYQMEINRKASKMAEHQTTVGDDKFITLNGAKLEQGASLPGIRTLKSSGAAPVVVEGRTGEQYLQPMLADIQELYQVMGTEDQLQDKPGETDPFTLVFRSASQKKVHSEKIERFEQYLMDFCETFMLLAQLYLPDTEVIPMIGSSEAVNIEEFRNSENLGYQIDIEPVSEDLETRMGKQLVLNQALQYGASVLGKEDFIKIIKSMPFGGMKDAFKDVVMTSEKADNVILALERGKMTQPNLYDDHPYMIGRLTNVVSQMDFETKNPQIQQNYQQLIAIHEQLQGEKEARLQAAKNEYIPTSGGLIACDFYVQDPNNPMNNKRARIPYDAVSWLIRQMELQGNDLSKLEALSPTSQANIMEAGAAMNASGGGMPTAGPGSTQPAQPQMGAPML